MASWRSLRYLNPRCTLQMGYTLISLGYAVFPETYGALDLLLPIDFNQCELDISRFCFVVFFLLTYR